MRTLWVRLGIFGFLPGYETIVIRSWGHCVIGQLVRSEDDDVKNEGTLSKTSSLAILPLQFLLDEGPSTRDQPLFSPCEDLKLLISDFPLPCTNACHH